MEFPSQDKPVIIATKGLPYTWTDWLARHVSGWARSPWVSLDYILEELFKEGGYTADRRPSEEEAERLYGLAFSRLCNAASFQLQQRLSWREFKCVVVESPLSSTKQLDQLIELSRVNEEDQDPFKLIILQVRLRQKLMWERSTVERYTSRDKKWYLPGSWVEVEEAIRDYDAKASEWDQHYHLMCSRHPHLKRLVLDPLLDIRGREIVSSLLTTTDEKKKMIKWSPFAKAIEYLLTDKAAPSAVEYRRWRKKLVEGLFLTTTTGACTNLLCSNSAGDCAFKYTTTSSSSTSLGVVVDCCRGCEQQLLGYGYYMCVSCNLALHKTCAEFPPVPHDFYFDLNNTRRTFDQVLVRNSGMTLRPCKSPCLEFSYECGGCVFETHLKCGLLPTVVDTPHLHPHPLSLQFLLDNGDRYVCELCSLIGYNCGYYCVICNSWYHVRCEHSPEQVEHEHGGYRHLMKLILPSDTTSTMTYDGGVEPLAFSADAYLDPDDSWCQACYVDLNSQAGFYACQDCPDYVAHVTCISPTWKGFPPPN